MYVNQSGGNFLYLGKGGRAHLAWKDSLNRKHLNEENEHGLTWEKQIMMNESVGDGREDLLNAFLLFSFIICQVKSYSS